MRWRPNLIKDLTRQKSDPAALLLSLAMPVLIGLLLRLISGDGSPPVATLMIADNDDTFVSGLITTTMSQGQMGELISASEVSEAEGRRLMDKGKASGLLIIPEGFSDNVLDRAPTTLTLITNPSQTILPGILQGSLEVLVDGVSGLQQVLAGPIDRINFEVPPGASTLPDSTVRTTATMINQLVTRAAPYLFPPVITVETVIENEVNPAQEQGFGMIFFPGMLLMAVLFTGQNLSADLWKERVQGTLRRILGTPQTLGDFLGGKLLSHALAMLIISFAGLALGRWAFRLPLENLLLASLWTAFAGFVMLLIFTLIQQLATSQRGGNLLTTVVLFPLIMLGGSFFPFEVMPDWLATLGRMTPNGWSLLQLKDILTDSVDPQQLGLTAAGLAVTAVLLVVINLLRLRSFARGV